MNPVSQFVSDPSLASTMLPGAHRSDGTDGQLEYLKTTTSVSWRVEYQLIKRLGAGGQGVVYLAEKCGAEGLVLPVSLKFFAPEKYKDHATYIEDMGRVARIASKVAMIQQDHILDVHNFVEFDGIRVMVMEWVDGYDLDFLTAVKTYARLRGSVENDRWDYLNNVVVTMGKQKARLQPGVAIAVLSECLSALSSLHRNGIIHGDVKPANIMLKRTGNAKIIDMGSACENDDLRGLRPFTPQYAAPEVLEKGLVTPLSDLASLGYVLVEMLSGQSPFGTMTDYASLIRAKQNFADVLPTLLPPEIQQSEALMQLVTGLVSPEPEMRRRMEDAADELQLCAAEFQRELVAGNLSSQYDMEIRLWLDDLVA